MLRACVHDGIHYLDFDGKYTKWSTVINGKIFVGEDKVNKCYLATVVNLPVNDQWPSLGDSSFAGGVAKNEIEEYIFGRISRICWKINLGESLDDIYNDPESREIVSKAIKEIGAEKVWYAVDFLPREDPLRDLFGSCQYANKAM